ncbi:hydroxypyruvate isomerase family protein [Belliella kenyensis]|uniref:Hydroxypyruvate isomerase family protein n=1 Tax=Belliella kenyensis TaxID=1472724 RepID=A0ABV8EJB0_9BACT|nr:TIM barrel protein [Belliella kenyensis]MCH7403142.1 TIM barrel protein [Belliella kenyensis]MDN3602311.1 TIM barrel protein [Belliella kenyensis]
MNQINRRASIKKIMAGTLAASAAPLIQINAEQVKNLSLKGNVNHAVCAWTFPHLSLDELCKAVKKIGFNAIDLVGPKDWHILKSNGVTCSMCNGAEISLVKGFNNKAYHDQLVKNYSEAIPQVAKAGYKNLICFSGNRDGMDDETGLQNSVEGLKKIIGIAEQYGVTLVMELLNSRVDHPDYMCDRTSWGVELCKRLGSENFKLLYDIYHMQIDEGDIIRTIKNNHQYIAHYHTAGNPGRNEIDDSQEINYPAVVKAIVETGFKGYVCQEFIPKAEDKLASLAEAVSICDV